jgi:hypothetical protein
MVGDRIVEVNRHQIANHRQAEVLVIPVQPVKAQAMLVDQAHLRPVNLRLKVGIRKIKLAVKNRVKFQTNDLVTKTVVLATV